MKNRIDTSAGAVSVVVDGAGASHLLVLAHGAGAGMSHPFMQTVAERLAAFDLAVVRFNFAYTEAEKKAPDRQSVLEDTYRGIVEHVRRELHPRRLFLGGKSMGGRIASHLAASGTACDGLVFLGYPLHPPGRPDRIRDAHLYDIRVPMLFVEGTRDPFCPLETLQTVRDKLAAPNEVALIADGDHSFKVRASSGRSTDEALHEVVDAVAAWIRRSGPGPQTGRRCSG